MSLYYFTLRFFFSVLLQLNTCNNFLLEIYDPDEVLRIYGLNRSNYINNILSHFTKAPSC